MPRSYFILMLGLFFSLFARATDAHEWVQIDTCYHWMTESQLKYKLDFAEKNGGRLDFHNGYVIYCWRSPFGAYSSWEEHGEEMIRIKFKPGARQIHKSREWDAGAAARDGDVRYSNDTSWHEYTIVPEAVESWSVYQPQTVKEIKAEAAFALSGQVKANDVFYPFSFVKGGDFVAFYRGFLQKRIEGVIGRFELAASQGKARIYGANPENHFKTSVNLPWRAFLEDNEISPAPPPPPPPAKISIVAASFGANLDRGDVGNATEPARQFCNGKTECDYKVLPKFMGLGRERVDEKDFEIEWQCDGDPNIRKQRIEVPAIGKVLKISC